MMGAVIHLVAVLFGGGTRMFDAALAERVNLEPVEVIETPVAIHQRFRRRPLTEPGSETGPRGDAWRVSVP